jgi:hypothetical protein
MVLIVLQVVGSERNSLIIPMASVGAFVDAIRQCLVNKAVPTQPDMAFERLSLSSSHPQQQQQQHADPSSQAPMQAHVEQQQQHLHHQQVQQQQLQQQQMVQQQMQQQQGQHQLVEVQQEQQMHRHLMGTSMEGNHQRQVL